MNRTVTVIISVIWFAIVIAYYSILTGSSLPAKDMQGSKAEWDSTENDATDRVQLPVYFEMDKSLPIKGENFELWLDGLKEAVGAKDTLLITGMYYSGETSGEILATSRSLAVQRLLSEEMDRSRLVVDFNQEVQPSGSELWVSGIKTEIRKLENPQLMTAEGIRVAFQPGQIQWIKEEETVKLLNGLRIRLADESGYSINIIAHTGSSGNAEKDYELGRKRAWVLKKYLMDLGFDPDKIVTDSKGSEQPESDRANYRGNDRAFVELRLNNSALQ